MSCSKALLYETPKILKAKITLGSFGLRNPSTKLRITFAFMVYQIPIRFVSSYKRPLLVYKAILCLLYFHFPAYTGLRCLDPVAFHKFLHPSDPRSTNTSFSRMVTPFGSATSLDSSSYRPLPLHLLDIQLQANLIMSSV